MDRTPGTAERLEATLSVDDPIARALVRASLFGDEAPSLGRYAVVRRIGAGGMGVVYEAHDAELDRNVALKVLPELADPSARARLPREAKALARLSHPNVVQVYDAGTEKGSFYIAMELVEGTNLRRWQDGRTVDEILDAYRGAARGVAAAHAAGLLHRDLKPENVLVGDDGRPRVVDFGLAADSVSSIPEHDDEALSPVRRGSMRAGTPGYMAPEQRAGEPLDRRSDVFSFCVALFEALAGAHPFPAEMATTGERAAVPWGRLPAATPRFVRAALARGLALDRADRFASMDDLLAALDRSPRPLLFGGIAVSVCVLAVAVALTIPAPAIASPCEELEPGAAWDDALATRLGEAFVRAQPGYGAASWSAVGPRLADLASSWNSTRARVCDGSLSPNAAAVGVRCLGTLHARFVAIIDRFEDGDAGAVERAAQMIDGLPPPDDCLALASGVPAHGAGRDPRAIAVDERIARLQDRRNAGDDVTAELEAVVAEAESIGDTEAMVHAWLVHAPTLHGRDHAGHVAQLSRAYFAASEAGLGDEAGNAALRLVQAHLHFDEIADAEAWMAHAQSTIDRFDLGQSTIDWYDDLRLQLFLMTDRIDEADALRRELTRRHEGRTDWLRTGLSCDLGNSAITRGRAKEAEEAFADCYRRNLASHGAGHPGLVPSLFGLSTAMQMQGRFDEGERLLLEALDAAGHEHPPSPLTIAQIHGNLSLALGNTRLAEAMVHGREALRYGELAHMSPSQLSEIHHSLGNIAHKLGDLDEAQLHYERERALVEAELGADHPDLGHALHSLGRNHMRRREFDLAEPLLQRALELWTGAYGPEHRLVSFPLGSLGELELERGRREAAIPLLRRALVIREANPSPPDKLADTRFALARALWPDRSTRTEAIELALGARDVYAKIGEPKQDKHDEVIAWLEQHARPHARDRRPAPR